MYYAGVSRVKDCEIYGGQNALRTRRFKKINYVHQQEQGETNKSYGAQNVDRPDRER